MTNAKEITPEQAARAEYLRLSLYGALLTFLEGHSDEMKISQYADGHLDTLGGHLGVHTVNLYRGAGSEHIIIQIHEGGESLVIYQFKVRVDGNEAVRDQLLIQLEAII